MTTIDGDRNKSAAIGELVSACERRSQVLTGRVVRLGKAAAHREHAHASSAHI